VIQPIEAGTAAASQALAQLLMSDTSTSKAEVQDGFAQGCHRQQP